MKQSGSKIKIFVTFGVLFVAASVLLLMIFFAGKKTYTVTFDLNGGTLISGSLEQTVTRGQDAVPPTVVKDGAYLRSWSRSYQRVTKDVTVRAVWEYETTPGIIYAGGSDRNYVEIAGAYEYLRGDVYLGAYYGEKKVLGIKDEAFDSHTGITRIFLLDGMLSIGSRAFASCTSLLEIDIPYTVTHLGESAFEKCTSLERVTLREGLTEIPSNAFKNCTSLTEIEIPASVTSIGEGAFDGCSSLEKITFHGGLEIIGKNAFKGCTSLTEIDVPETVTHIEEGAFRGCRALENVILHEGLVSVGENAFRACLNLEEIDVPESVTEIGDNAFAFKKLLGFEIAFPKDFEGVKLPEDFPGIIERPSIPVEDLEKETGSEPESEPETEPESEPETELQTFVPIFRPRQTMPPPPEKEGEGGT